MSKTAAFLSSLGILLIAFYYTGMDNVKSLVRTTSSSIAVDKNEFPESVSVKKIEADISSFLPPPTPPPPPVFDSSNKGTNFWVAYGHHQFFGSGNSQQMVIYLSAEQAANVTVKVNGTTWVTNYAIPANTVQVSEPIPKTGVNDARLLVEGLSSRGISITSDVPIVAYAHIYAGLTSGATMLLPTGTYGYEYRALGASQAYPTGLGSSYSWINVIADNDNTMVEIIPAAPTVGGHAANVPFTVTLNKGDVYQVLGALISPASGHDLTGTTVRSIQNANGSCYPIAVFSGSSRTALCNEFGGDNLIQQVFPSTAWGSKYLTVPTVSTTSTASFNANIYRVAVKDPATIVKRNGVILTGLVNNYYYQFISATPDYIEADKPIMVAQIMPSQGAQASQCPGVSFTGLIDPELIYISPIEQAIKKIVFYSTPNAAVANHYVNLIIPEGGLASLTIDGSNIFDINQPHPSLPGFRFIVKKLLAGQHIAQSDTAFTAIAYGAASEESYGYNAGTLVKNLNAIPAITNILNVSGASTEYTCVNTPFRFNILLPVKPSLLTWKFSQVPSMTPNANVIQTNPSTNDSVLINGRWFYKYTVAQEYMFGTTGSFNVPISITHPAIEGCSNTMDQQLTVNVLAAPVVDFITDFSGCAGSIALFQGSFAPVNNVLPHSWSWTFHDATTSNAQVTTKLYPTAGTFNVDLRVIGTDGCVGDTTKTITVKPTPPIAVVTDSIAVCSGASATFNVLNPVPGQTYNWYTTITAGTPVFTGASFTLNNVTSSIIYYVEAVENGCASQVRQKARLNVLSALTAPVVVVDSAGLNQIRFRWNAVPGATSYEISINNGASWSSPSSGIAGLTHTITGLLPLQSVTIIVRAKGGCVDMISQPVTGRTVSDEIFIPNTFTPNGDGLNDVLRVYALSIRDYHFMVFNQWGEKVFESKNQNTGWNGTHKGKGQPSGVYMYVCRFIMNDGSVVNKKGSVNLIR